MTVRLLWKMFIITPNISQSTQKAESQKLRTWRSTRALKIRAVWPRKWFKLHWACECLWCSIVSPRLFSVLIPGYFTFYVFYTFMCLQFSLVTQSCPTLCDLTDYSTPGFPVHHQLPKPAHVFYLHFRCLKNAFCLNVLSLQYPCSFFFFYCSISSRILIVIIISASWWGESAFLHGENWHVGIVNGFFVLRRFSKRVLFRTNSAWKQES